MAGRKADTLSLKQKIFLAELIANPTMDATAAARKAGYKDAATSAAMLLKKPAVRDALERLTKEKERRSLVKADRILEELACLALRDVIDLCDPRTGRVVIDDMRKVPERARRCIDGIKCRQYCDEEGNVTQEVELRLVPKLGALELLAKHLGMLAPQQHTVNVMRLDWDRLFEEERENPSDVIEVEIARASIADGRESGNGRMA